REVPTAEAARELLGIPAVGLDAVAGLDGYQGGRDDDAGDVELRELPVERITTGPGFVAHAEGVDRAELTDELPHGFRLVRDDSESVDFTARLGDGDSNRGGVNIETDESYILHTDRLLSHVALRYALVTPSRSVIYGLRL